MYEDVSSINSSEQQRCLLKTAMVIRILQQTGDFLSSCQHLRSTVYVIRVRNIVSTDCISRKFPVKSNMYISDTDL